MNKYVIVTDTACDLDVSFQERFNFKVLPMHYIIDGKDYAARLDWAPFTPKSFYDIIRNGTRITTAQIGTVDYKNAFKELIEQGYDVLYIACSSALSASVKASYVVRDELLKEYPNAKIVCVDTLRACHALGILVLTACELKEEGKTLEEVAEWVENNKLTANMEGSVEKLTYLRMAGRVNAASAFFGGLLNIKPIIVADAKGQNFAIEKVKGRKQSLQRIADRFVDNYVQVPHQKIFISHADCLEDANILKEMLLEKLEDKNIPIHIGYVGSCIGATVGPGMIGAYYFGKEVTLNKE